MVCLTVVGMGYDYYQRFLFLFCKTIPFLFAKI